jgi:hypothetical protein
MADRHDLGDIGAGLLSIGISYCGRYIIIDDE